LLDDAGANVVTCDLGGLRDPDAGTIDLLARLQLTARRLGGSIQLRHACDDLQDLLAFVGLDDVLPVCSGLPLEAQGQVEEREQVGAEERVDPADPAC
jgi:hypothetical protein